MKACRGTERVRCPSIAIKRFLEEWDQLEQRIESPEERALIVGLRRLAVRCMATAIESRVGKTSESTPKLTRRQTV